MLSCHTVKLLSHLKRSHTFALLCCLEREFAMTEETLYGVASQREFLPLEQQRAHAR